MTSNSKKSNPNAPVPLQVQSELKKVETRAKGAIRLVFDTQEDVSTDIRAKMMAGVEKVGWLSFFGETQKLEDISKLPKINQEDSMYENLSKSQRLKFKLYKFFKTYNEIHQRKFTDKREEREAFTKFYNNQMEKMISKWEEKSEEIMQTEGGEV